MGNSKSSRAWRLDGDNFSSVPGFELGLMMITDERELSLPSSPKICTLNHIPAGRSPK